MWVVVISAMVAAVVGGLIGAEVGSESQQTIVKQFFPNNSVLARPQDIQEILAKVEPAVVSIAAESAGGGSSSGGDFVEAAGSGMILTPDGEVLTNNHVVEGATSVSVTLFGQTNALPSHVLGTDPSDDLALIQIDHASNLPTVTLGDSSQTRVGDTVLAIGNALALAGGPTVTEGIVSAEDRSLSAENDNGQTENLTGLIQTDAAINPGNSGGPLVNTRAQVVGMNTAVASSTSGNAPTENIGFAITVDSAKPLLAHLRQGGTGGAGSAAPQLNPVANSAYLGVTVGPVTPSLQQQDHLTPSSGALIISVEPGSPAQKSALHVDDVIVSFNGAAIQSPDDLTAAIHPLSPGDHVVVGIYRGSTRIKVGVTLGARPSRRLGCRATIPGGTSAMTPVTDEQILPEEDGEPPPPVGHVRVVYLGPVAPHWEVQSDYGDPALIEEFRRRTMARLVLLPPHDPQYRRNRGAGDPRCRAGEHPARVGPGGARGGSGRRRADRAGRRGRAPPTSEADERPSRHGQPDAGCGSQSPGGASSPGRLIRSSHNPGASTSDGVGRLLSETHSLARPSSPARSSTPLMNDRPRSTWAWSRSSPNSAPAASSPLPRSVRRRYQASASWAWDPTSFCPTRLAT